MNNKRKFALFVGFLVISLIVAILSGIFGFNLSSLEKLVSANYAISVIVYLLLFVVLIAF
jgi:hypothetical protein